VASRPGGQNRWDGKPAGIVSVTPYKLGAFGANHALRQAVVFLNVPVMQQPEAYIGGAGELFDKNGKLTSKETGEFLGKFMAAFKTWVTALAKGASDGDFEGFLATRRKVASAYSSGDAGPLDAIVAREGDATFFPPTGGSVTGAKAVVARYDADARAFSPGSKTGLDVLQSAGSGELAFWTGFQDFEGKIGGQDAKMKLRVTELFRREGDGWKLIHRHADPGSEAKPKG
jgi:ketosteroid isomerase-like protein